jgi:hypothetical protein
MGVLWTLSNALACVIQAKDINGQEMIVRYVVENAPTLESSTRQHVNADVLLSPLGLGTHVRLVVESVRMEFSTHEGADANVLRNLHGLDRNALTAQGSV